MSFENQKILLKYFMEPQFSHCALIRMCSSGMLSDKIKRYTKSIKKILLEMQVKVWNAHHAKLPCNTLVFCETVILAFSILQFLRYTTPINFMFSPMNTQGNKLTNKVIIKSKEFPIHFVTRFVSSLIGRLTLTGFSWMLQSYCKTQF